MTTHTHPDMGVPYHRSTLGPDGRYHWAECPECHALAYNADGYGAGRHWLGTHCPACPDAPDAFDLRALMPPKLRRVIRPTDTPVTPTAGGWDTRCGWDDASHPDDIRPVCVAIEDDTYSGSLGRMCAVHYRAVLESRRRSLEA